ncbi:unnamed protein product [Pedinophyceae sp. YPF-701]|nr:unnamed protein product [Pedinophyceae sp. YPF-701]
MIAARADTGSYMAQHTARSTLHGQLRAAMCPAPPDKLLTDRAAYISYLESQLERVTNTCMTVQSYEARLHDAADVARRCEAQMLEMSSRLQSTRGSAADADAAQRKAFAALLQRVADLEGELRERPFGGGGPGALKPTGAAAGLAGEAEGHALDLRVLDAKFRAWAVEHERRTERRMREAEERIVARIETALSDLGSHRASLDARVGEVRAELTDAMGEFRDEAAGLLGELQGESRALREGRSEAVRGAVAEAFAGAATRADVAAALDAVEAMAGVQGVLAGELGRLTGERGDAAARVADLRAAMAQAVPEGGGELDAAAWGRALDAVSALEAAVQGGPAGGVAGGAAATQDMRESVQAIGREVVSAARSRVAAAGRRRGRPPPRAPSSAPAPRDSPVGAGRDASAGETSSVVDAHTQIIQEQGSLIDQVMSAVGGIKRDVGSSSAQLEVLASVVEKLAERVSQGGSPGGGRARSLSPPRDRPPFVVPTSPSYTDRVKKQFYEAEAASAGRPPRPGSSATSRPGAHRSTSASPAGSPYRPSYRPSPSRPPEYGADVPYGAPRGGEAPHAGGAAQWRAGGAGGLRRQDTLTEALASLEETRRVLEGSRRLSAGPGELPRPTAGVPGRGAGGQDQRAPDGAAWERAMRRKARLQELYAQLQAL